MTSAVLLRPPAAELLRVLNVIHTLALNHNMHVDDTMFRHGSIVEK